MYCGVYKIWGEYMATTHKECEGIHSKFLYVKEQNIDSMTDVVFPCYSHRETEFQRGSLTGTM